MAVAASSSDIPLPARLLGLCGGVEDCPPPGFAPLPPPGLESFGSPNKTPYAASGADACGSEVVNKHAVGSRLFENVNHVPLDGEAQDQDQDQDEDQDQHQGQGQNEGPAQDPELQLQFPEGTTAYMVQNLSRKLSRAAFLHILDDMGFAHRYNYAHVPIVFGTGRNKGFAFVNFLNEADAAAFAKLVANLPVAITGQKAWRLFPAKVQGTDANAAVMAMRKTSRIRRKVNKPLFIPTPGDDSPVPAEVDSTSSMP